MNTSALGTKEQQTWYLATLGREALLRELAPLGLPASMTYDPLALAALVVAPGHNPAAHQAAQRVLSPLSGAKVFSVVVTDEIGPVHFTGVVPVLTERAAGAVTAQYAELLLFEMGGLANKTAFRLSRLPSDRAWIIDAEFQPNGALARQQPFGSARLGRNRTVAAPVVSELNRLAAQTDWGTT